MKKLLLLSIAALGFYSSDLYCPSLSLKATTTKVINNTQSDIFVAFNSITASCIGGCNYKHIGAGKSDSPTKSLAARQINVVAFTCQGGRPQAVKKEGISIVDVSEIVITQDSNGEIVATPKKSH